MWSCWPAAGEINLTEMANEDIMRMVSLDSERRHEGSDDDVAL